MIKLSILFLVVCVASLLDQSVGLNYYLKTNPGSNTGLVTYTLIPAFRRPDCGDKRKEKDESSSSSEESSSSESSESSSEESKGNKESGEKKDKKESKESKSKEGGSEESKSRSEEDSSEEEGDKKEDKKDDSNSLFPPRTYNFPPSKIRKIIYTPLSTYAYSPYRSTYVVQQPPSYSLTKNGYQYFSAPETANGANDSKSSVARRLVNSPVAKIVYSPSALSYPAVSKTALSPGASVYSAQDYWNNPFIYFKK